MAFMESVEELTQIKELKKLIISQAKAFYGPKHPGCDTFDVVLSAAVFDDPDIEDFTARIIVYPPKPSLQWRCVALVTEHACRVLALEGLLKKIEREFDHAVYDIKEGDVFKGY